MWAVEERGQEAGDNLELQERTRGGEGWLLGGPSSSSPSDQPWIPNAAGSPHTETGYGEDSAQREAAGAKGLRHLGRRPRSLPAARSARPVPRPEPSRAPAPPGPPCLSGEWGAPWGPGGSGAPGCGDGHCGARRPAAGLSFPREGRVRRSHNRPSRALRGSLDPPLFGLWCWATLGICGYLLSGVPLPPVLHHLHPRRCPCGILLAYCWPEERRWSWGSASFSWGNPRVTGV